MAIHILLVDDHDLMRDGLRAILERESDFQVVGEARGGREAVRKAAELAPDVVVMDVAMEDLNGIEATRQIKAERPETKVVALSSHADSRYVKRMLRAGASAYILKARAYEELRRGLRASLLGQSYLCSDVSNTVVEVVRADESEDGSAYGVLGPREREVLQLLAEGLSSPEIARRLYISHHTVESHRRNIMRKLDLHNVAALTKYAIREGLTTTDAVPTHTT